MNLETFVEKSIRFYSDIVVLHYVDALERRYNVMFTRYMIRNHTVV